MTYDELLAGLPDDATVTVGFLRCYVNALREAHERELEDVIRQVWHLRDLQSVQRGFDEAVN